jgi:phosphopantothenoylcysteine decarboxylase/phosphopantothenate--cysteine ligase
MVHTAAVIDFTIERNNKKIKSTNRLNLELTPTTKILEKIKQLNKKVILIGFKAEYNVSEQELVDRAYDKLLKSGDRLEGFNMNDVEKTIRKIEKYQNYLNPRPPRGGGGGGGGGTPAKRR